LETEVATVFPAQKDNFQRLVSQISGYDDLDELAFADQSARARVSETITDPLLVEMLFAPLMYYGSARQHDMDWGQFCIMFRSIFLEGLARPLAGVRLILKTLVRRYKELGGELRLRSGVNRIAVEGDAVTKVVLDDGTELSAKRVLSSAGWFETMRMCDDVSTPQAYQPGQLSFIESISILDRPPRELGCKETIVFYNDSEQFHWQKPDSLVDVRSGVICSPNNFAYDSAEGLSDGVMRITSLANYDRWNALPEAEYRLEKLRWYDAQVASAVSFTPDFRHAVIDTDLFTPATIRRFTGHLNGAVYGAPDKQLSGATHLKNLFVCGTDQGYVGIIGTLVSGISVANRHLLRDAD
jgi:phytoene dehydrogenase-like protein